MQGGQKVPSLHVAGTATQKKTEYFLSLFQIS